MPSILKIDQAGLPAGVAGKSRTDGLATGALVTLENTGGGTTLFELLDVPLGDTTAVASLAATLPGSNVWTFTPTAAVYGTYRVRLTKNAGLATEAIEIRHLRVRTPNLGLIIPALNEVADFRANLINSGAAEIEASEDNADDYPTSELNARRYAGWWRALTQWISSLDSFVTSGTINAQIWDPDVGADTALRKATFEACLSALNSQDGFGVIVMPEDDQDVNPYTIVGSGTLNLDGRIGILNQYFDKTITLTDSTGVLANPWFVKSIGATLEFQRQTAADTTPIFRVDRDQVTTGSPTTVELENVIGRVTATGFAPFISFSIETAAKMLAKNCEFDARAIEVFTGSTQTFELRLVGDQTVVPSNLLVDGDGFISADCNVWIEGAFAWSEAMAGAQWLGATPTFNANAKRFPSGQALLEALANDGTTVLTVLEHNAGADELRYNGVPLTAAGGGALFLADDGTYKMVSATIGDAKSSVRAVATSDVPSLSGTTTIDGVSLVAGNRVLLTAQTSGSGAVDNGIWIVQAGAWTRPADFDTGDSAASAFVFVEEGTTNADTGWLCTSDEPNAIDTDANVWVLLLHPGVTEGANVGTGGAQVFRDRTANTLNFRNVQGFTNNGNDIEPNGLSRTLYVDANAGAGGDGNILRPFTTIAAALTAASTTDVHWIIHIQPGTYSENLTFPNDRVITLLSSTVEEQNGIGHDSDGTFDVHIVADTGHTLATVATTGQGSLRFRGVRLLTNGLTISGTGDAYIFALHSDLVGITRTTSGEVHVFLDRSTLRSFTGGASGADQGVIAGVMASLVVSSAWDVNSINLQGGSIDVSSSAVITVDGTEVELRDMRFLGASPPTFDFATSGDVVMDPETRARFDAASGVVTDGTLEMRQLLSKTIGAADFDTPDSADWTVNAAASLGADPVNAGLDVLAFADSAEQGAGFLLFIPEGATHIRFRFVHGSRGSAAGGDVQWALYRRQINDNTAVASWSTALDLDVFTIPTNTNFQYESQRISLSTLGLTAGLAAQFELTRQPADVDDTLGQTLHLLQLECEIT